MKKYCLESQLRHEKHIFVAYFLANWLKSYDREKSSQNISREVWRQKWKRVPHFNLFVWSKKYMRKYNFLFHVKENFKIFLTVKTKIHKLFSKKKYSQENEKQKYECKCEHSCDVALISTIVSSTWRQVMKTLDLASANHLTPVTL